MKNLAKFLSGILIFIFVSSTAFAQNLNGSWYEDTLHERSRLRNYFYRINDGKLSVVDKKNNKEEIFFDFTIANGYIDIRSTGKTSPKITVGKFPIQIKYDNYFTIGFSKPMSFVRNSYAKEQAVDATKTAATVAAIGYGTAVVGAVGEKAVVASGLAGGASKASANVSKRAFLNTTVGEKKQNFVYRVIRPDENPKQGLHAKNPSRNMTIEGHVTSGNRNYGSQYISTTTDLNIAQDYAQRDGCRIVKINLNKVPDNVKVYDLSTQAGRDTYLKGITAKNFAKASKEVLLEGVIPSDAIELVK